MTLTNNEKVVPPTGGATHFGEMYSLIGNNISKTQESTLNYIHPKLIDRGTTTFRMFTILRAKTPDGRGIIKGQIILDVQGRDYYIS